MIIVWTNIIDKIEDYYKELHKNYYNAVNNSDKLNIINSSSEWVSNF